MRCMQWGAYGIVHSRLLYKPEINSQDKIITPEKPEGAKVCGARHAQIETAVDEVISAPYSSL